MYRQKILALLSKVLEIDYNDVIQMPEETKLSDIGMTSIRFIELVIELERELDIEINDSDLLVDNFRDIRAIFNLISKYIQNNWAVKKVLILDCDNLLWTGVAGEEELVLSCNNIAFQNEVIQLYKRGVIICLCSKNQQSNIFEAFASLGMPLNFTHISSYKINYLNKADNIIEISRELNLDLDSFVFVDDSQYELGLVSRTIPEIKTIHANYDNLDFIDEMKRLFDGATTTDMDRTKLYREQKEREKEKDEHLTIPEYNKLIGTEAVCEIATLSHAKRIAELSQRTNQFNLSNKRYTENEIETFINDKQYWVLYISAKDKYGDMGIVGACIIKGCEIDSFFISCRAFDRGFENLLLEKVKELLNNEEIKGIYVETDKNKRFSNFYTENGVLLSGRLS